MASSPFQNDYIATGNAETKPVTRDLLTYAAKAADLSGVDLVLTHQPENWKGPAEDLSGALSSSIQDTGRVKPVLVSANITWLAGEPFRLKLPRTAGIGGVTAQLGGQGTRKPVPVAMAEAIVFEFVAPDGRQERVVRELFDFMGKARRVSQKHLATEEVRNRTEGKNTVEVAANIYSMLVTTGRLDPSHLSAVALPAARDEHAFRCSRRLAASQHRVNDDLRWFVHVPHNARPGGDSFLPQLSPGTDC
jgi:hypothetical protein